MALDLEKVHKLELIINGAKDRFDELSEWEQGFVVSIEERYKEYKDGVLISDKQWGILDRIYEIVV
jgi:hypothetical protein